MINIPSSRIATLIIRSDKKPEIIHGLARRERRSIHAISPNDVTIWIDKHIHRDYQDEFRVKNGIFIKHTSVPPEKWRYHIYPPDGKYDFEIVFFEGFSSINFKLNKVSTRNGLGEKMPGDFIYKLKRGAGCYFEIASRAYILQATENGMNILCIQTGETVSTF